MSSPATAELADQVTRLADRLRSMGEGRLARELPPYGSRADAALAAAQALADLAADLEGVAHRTLPRLGDLAVGDQVAVTGHDLVAAAEGRPDADRLVAEAAERLRALRLDL